MSRNIDWTCFFSTIFFHFESAWLGTLEIIDFLFRSKKQTGDFIKRQSEIPEFLPKSFQLTVVRMQQMPHKENTGPREDVFCLKGAIYTCMRKVCVNCQTDSNKFVFLKPLTYIPKRCGKENKSDRIGKAFFSNESISWATMTNFTSRAFTNECFLSNEHLPILLWNELLIRSPKCSQNFFSNCLSFLVWRSFFTWDGPKVYVS